MDSNFLQYNRRVNIPTELLPRRSVDELDTAFSSLSGKERQELTSKQIRDRTRVLAPLRQEVQKEWDVVQKPVREVLSKLSSAISHTIPVLEAFKELDSAVEHIREGSTSELPAPAARAIEKLQMAVGREGGHLLPVYYEKLADTLSTHKEERLAQFHSQNSQNRKLALEFFQHVCELNARFPEVISAEQVNRVEGAVTAFTLPLPEGITPQPQDAINTQQELLAAMAEVEETIGRHSPKISLTDPRLRVIARERVERLQGGTIKPPPQEQTKKAVELSLTLGLVKFDAERTVLDANRLAESIVTELLENFQAREIKSAANRLFDRLERERSKNPTSFTRNGQLELDDIISGKQPETMHLSKLPAPYCSVSQDSVLQFRLVLEPLIDEFTAKRTVLAETFGYSPREATAGARARSLEDINRSKQLCETAAIEPQLATALYKANPSLFHKTEDEVRATFDAVERFCHEHQEYLSIAIYNPKKNPAAFGSVDAVNAQIAAIRTALSTSEGSASLRSELSNSRFQSAVKELALGKPLQLVATLLRYGFASADGTATSGTEPLNAKTIRQKVKEALPEFEANEKAVRDCLLVLSEAKLVTRSGGEARGGYKHAKFALPPETKADPAHRSLRETLHEVQAADRITMKKQKTAEPEVAVAVKLQEPPAHPTITAKTASEALELRRTLGKLKRGSDKAASTFDENLAEWDHRLGAEQLLALKATIEIVRKDAEALAKQSFEDLSPDAQRLALKFRGEILEERLKNMLEVEAHKQGLPPQVPGKIVKKTVDRVVNEAIRDGRIPEAEESLPERTVPMAALLLDLTEEESEALLASLDLTITHALNEKTRRLEEDMKWGVRLIEGAEKSVKRLGYISGVPNDFGRLASDASKNIRKLLPEEREERSAEALLESCTKFREIFTPVRASLESIRDHLRGVNVLSEELEKVVKAVKDKELFPATLRPVKQLIREAKPFLGPSGISDPLATVLLDFEKRQKPERTIIADVPEGSA